MPPSAWTWPPRRTALLAAVLAGLFAACTSAPEPAGTPAPLTVAYRLIDQRGGSASPSPPAVAAIGDTTRNVFSAPTVLISRSPTDGWTAGPSAGELSYSMPCQEALIGRSFPVLVQPPAAAMFQQAGLVECKTADDHVALHVPSSDGPRVVVAFVPPASEAIRTDWLEIPQGARLRAAIGLADPRPRASVVPAHARIWAENERGDRALVYERQLDDVQWHELDVALDAATRSVGARQRLVFESEAAAAALHFAVWGDPVILKPAAAGAARPRNVILISLDTLRSDRLGLYGAKRQTSPFLDALSRRSAVFEQAIATAPHTFPSHATMLTGLYPCAHGLGDGSASLFSPLPRPVVPIAEALRRAGYTAAAFTEDAFVAPESFQRGFDSFRADKRNEVNKLLPLGNAQDTFAAAAGWLRAHGDAPFFLFVHTYQVHEPYTPPETYAKLFSENDGTVDAAARALERQDLLALYDAEIRMTDEVLSGFFAALEQAGLTERTVVVVTSDHGQGFGAHGSPGHGRRVYDDTLHVPMLWYAPGLIPPARHDGGVVSLADVAPTLYELLGLAAPNEMQGRSLAATLTAAALLDPKRTVFAKGLGKTAPSTTHGYGWKVIRQSKGPAERFDLRTDPHEQSPQVGADTEPGLALLAEHERTCAALRERVAHERPVASNVPDAERDEKLRALGYIE